MKISYFLLVTIFANSIFNCISITNQKKIESYKRVKKNKIHTRDRGKIETENLTSQNPVIINLNFSNQNKIYKIRKNATIHLKIRGNMTTGYSWFVEGNSIKNKDFNFLNLDDSNSTNDYKTDSHLKGMVGVGGSFIFKVKLIETGIHHLDFINKRPWENNYESLLTANFEVSN